MKQLQRRGRRYWRDAVSMRPLARQRAWLEDIETRRIMGDEWCERKARYVDRAERQLKELVPSGAWFEAAWRGNAPFPPQDEVNLLAIAAALYGMAATGRISERQLLRSLEYMTAGADPLQVCARISTRMRFSRVHTSYGSGHYAGIFPIPLPPTRRLVPRVAVGVEDELDRMSSSVALFYDGPRSPSATAIVRLGFTRGRDQAKLDRERRRKIRAERAEHKQKVKAAKEKAGKAAD